MGEILGLAAAVAFVTEVAKRVFKFDSSIAMGLALVLGILYGLFIFSLSANGLLQGLAIAAVAMGEYDVVKKLWPSKK